MPPPELEADLDLGGKTSLNILILGNPAGEERVELGKALGFRGVCRTQ